MQTKERELFIDMEIVRHDIRRINKAVYRSTGSRIDKCFAVSWSEE